MPIRPRRIILRSLIVFVLVLAFPAARRPSAAPLNSSDPMAIISAVNALRATQGLPPYIVDQGLMDYALEHSRYQASLHTATHQHSDGSTVWQHGMDENIAEGMLGYLTPEYAVYTIWSDAIHMKTMIGYATGYVGAGVADDGANEYYTLDVRPGNVVSGTGKGTTVDPDATPTKIVPIVPLLTVTPRADRWLIHTVGYGQSLWAVAIAYGVKMQQLRDWNSMPEDSTEIYAGQKLYIIAPPEVWPTFTPSPVGGPANPEQTVAPGWLMTEEPGAATQKAAYQTAAAQTQSPQTEGDGSQAMAVSGVETTASPATASNLTAQNSMVSNATALNATASPTLNGQAATSADSSAPDGNTEAGSLPLTAGLLLLLGGSLLFVAMFTMLRRR